jgi:UDP-glucose:(heptosyl)LPS alpha-1,3-glucosyltransferase
MKIARVVHRYNKQEGISRGVAEVVEKLAREHEVHVFANSWDDVGDSGIIFHKVPQMPQWPNRWIAQILGFFIFSARMLKKDRFDIVHLHNSSAYPCDVITCHGLHRGGINLIRNTYKDRGADFSLRGTIKILMMLPILEYNYSNARQKKIIAVSQSIKSELIQFCKVPPEDIVVIPNGVNIDEFHPRNREIFRDKIRNRFSIKKNDFIFLFVGNFFRRKGLRFVLDAFYRLRDANIKLMVVGADTPRDQDTFMRKATDMGLKDRVIFLGHTPHVNRFYAASDAFILPTLYEAFSLGILEAMASGLPVITTEIAGATGLISDGIDGLLLQSPVDDRQLREMMEMLIENNDLCDSLGREARKTAEKYTWDMVARETIKLYRGIVGEKSGSKRR